MKIYGNIDRLMKIEVPITRFEFEHTYSTFGYQGTSWIHPILRTETYVSRKALVIADRYTDDIQDVFLITDEGIKLNLTCLKIGHTKKQQLLSEIAENFKTIRKELIG